MNFETAKQNLDFPLGLAPVIVITWQRNQYTKKGQLLKGKKYTKKWQEFHNKYIDGKGMKDGYETIVLDNRPEIDLDQDLVEYQEEFAIIGRNVVGYLSELTEVQAKLLLSGVRFLSQDGELLSTTDIEEVKDLYPTDGSLDDILMAYEQVYKTFVELQREAEEYNSDISQRAITEEVQEELADTEAFEESEVVEDDSDEMYDNTYEEQDEPYHYESDQPSDIEDDGEVVSPEEFIAEDLDTFSNSFVSPNTVSDDLTLIGVDLDDDGTLTPIFNLKKKELQSLIDETNDRLKEIREEAITSVRRAIESDALSELDKLLSATDPEDESSEFYSGLALIERSYQVQQDKILNEHQTFINLETNSFEQKKEEYVNRILQQVSLEYDQENRPDLERRIEEHETKLKNALEAAHQEARQEIIDQAEDKFESELSNIVSNVAKEHSAEIENILTQYKTTTSSLISSYETRRRTETENLKADAMQILNRRYDYDSRTQAEVDALLKAKAPELANLEQQLELSERAKEEAENKADENRKATESYRKRLSALEKRYEATESERLELKEKVEAVRDEYESNEINRKKRISLIGRYAVVVAAILGVAVIGATVYSSNSETDRLEKEIKQLKTKANAEYRVGEYVPVDTGNNKVAYGKVISVKNKEVTVLVKDSDGQEKKYKFNY